MYLASAVFAELVSCAIELPDSRQEVEFEDGAMGWQAAVSFYKSKKYNKALGKSLLYYDSNGVAIGFCDKYDFNPKRIGSRPLKYEIMTRGARIYGKLWGGKGYDIRYGKTAGAAEIPVFLTKWEKN